jgi:MFS family permease
MKTIERHFNWFIVLLIFSLVGNACADFAVLWHCVARISGGQLSNGTSHFVTSFYAGQALGAILLAPFLAVWVDRHGRRFSSVALDVVYAIVLLLMLISNELHILSPEWLLPFGAVTAALGSLHRGAIGYGAIKMVGEQLRMTKLVAKFHAAVYTTNLLGVLMSGFLYKSIGLNGCLLVAIATFFPMPFIYFKLFKRESPAAVPTVHDPILTEIKAGFSFISADRRLWVNTLVSAVWNIASNIFPGLVAIAFQKSFPGRTDYGSIAVSVAILTGVISFAPMERVAKYFSLKCTTFYALSPSIIVLAFCVLSASPYLIALAFALHCAGGALINITSGALRVSSVPKPFIGRVNTAHFAMVSLGQVVGSLTLVPMMSTSIAWGAGMILLTYILAVYLGFVLFPKVRLSEAIGVS